MCGRRAGKSFVLALIAVFLACFYEYGKTCIQVIFVSVVSRALVALHLFRRSGNHSDVVFPNKPTGHKNKEEAFHQHSPKATAFPHFSGAASLFARRYSLLIDCVRSPAIGTEFASHRPK